MLLDLLLVCFVLWLAYAIAIFWLVFWRGPFAVTYSPFVAWWLRRLKMEAITIGARVYLHRQNAVLSPSPSKSSRPSGIPSPSESMFKGSNPRIASKSSGKPSWVLKPAESAVAHCMMLIASMIASRGVMERLVTTMVGVRYYENDANQWSSLFFPHLKPWMVPWDPKADEAPVARYFYEGLPAGEPIPWSSWALPLAGWMVLYLIVFGAFLCLATIVYRQWSHHEKLTFPLVALPLEMIESRGG